MKVNHQVVSLVATFVIAASAIAVGQDQDPAAQAKAAAQVAQEIAKAAQEADFRAMAASIKPLKVVIVISRYQGEKKISSMPYTLSVNANDGTGAKLRMGAQVPLPVAATPAAQTQFGGPMQYKEIGTYIDCQAKSFPDNRFRLELTIENSSVYADPAAARTDGVVMPPALRSFRLNNTAILSDGQSTQFSTATDSISGEVHRIDITLTVVK